MQQPLFHVVLEGRRLGPYDRRTIVGMRIKKTLSSEHVLVDSAGAQLTVGDLIGRRPRESIQRQRAAHSTIVQASYPAALRSVHGEGLAIPPFKGELELRVHTEVLRIAGRCRKGWTWKDERIKLPLKDIVHAQADGSEVDLGVRTEGGALQRLQLELFAPDSAAELLQWFPAASPWPAAAQAATQVPPLRQWLWAWAAAGGATIVVLVLVGLVIARRLY